MVVQSIHPVGPIIFIEATQPGSDDIIDIQQPKKVWSALDVNEGDTMYIRPEKIGIFQVDDYVI